MDSDNFINPEDFKSMQVVGAMYNVTSKTGARTSEGAKKAAGPSAKSLSYFAVDEDTLAFLVVEILEKGLVIEAPRHSCAVGHNLALEFWVKNTSQRVRVSASARVLEVDPHDPETQKVTVEFLKFDQAAWEKFCALYSDAQEKVLELFHSIRGY